MFEIVFRWPVAQEYEISDKLLSAVHLTGTKSQHRPFPVKWHQPLESNPALYLEFLNLDGSGQSCLAFAKKNGLLVFNVTEADPWSNEWRVPGGGELTWSKGVTKCSEYVDMWMGAIKKIRRLQSFLESTRTDPAELFGSRKQFHLSAPLALSLAMKARRGLPTLEFRCGTLLDAIELQCVRSFLAGRGSYQCVECSSWFEVGPGAGHRSHAVFCSRTCKDHHHNRLKAEKAKAEKAKAKKGN